VFNLENHIRSIPDFPKKGIAFKDITPLLSNPVAVNQCLDELVTLVENQKIDKVVGIESRGFFFATLLAQKLNAGFIPIRKKGKLPYKTHQASYSLEYGEDVIEIHQDAISKGERILLHDDVLATGGTAKAATELITKLGGELVQCNFLIELSFLKGRQLLHQYPVASILTY